MGTRFRRRNAPIARLGTVAAVMTALIVSAGAVAAAEDGADGPEYVEGTPCTVTARACVDFYEDQAWLIEDGEVVLGPVDTRTGAEGVTPLGTFQVQWKNRHHRSTEFDGAPMPFAVFFAPGGIAFHEGDLDSGSAGCVRLSHDDAAQFFDHLQVGDEVQVV
jgi:hypothetical protein